MTRASAAALLLSVLAACSSTEELGTGRQILSQLQSFRGNQEGNRVTATDAQLRAYPRDLLLVEIPSRDSSAGLQRQVVNRSSVTWVAPDGVALTLRNGVVIGSAGLPGDLSSAAVPDIRRVRGGAVRDHYYLDGDEQVRRMRFTCAIADRGAAAAEVAGLSHPARLITEECSAVSGIAFRNRYWLQGDGVIRRSRQWLSPEVGYLVIGDVHGGRGL